MSTCLELAPVDGDHNNTELLHHDERKFEDLSQREKRSLIFHLLYASESFDNQTSLESIVDNFNRGFDLDIPIESAVVSTSQYVIDLRDSLDEAYKPLLSNWRFDRLGVCTKLILRHALWELLYTDTLPTIIINEAIELAKCFAEKDAYKFINGVLDKAVTQFVAQKTEQQ